MTVLTDINGKAPVCSTPDGVAIRVKLKAQPIPMDHVRELVKNGTTYYKTISNLGKDASKAILKSCVHHNFTNHLLKQKSQRAAILTESPNSLQYWMTENMLILKDELSKPQDEGVKQEKFPLNFKNVASIPEIDPLTYRITDIV